MENVHYSLIARKEPEDIVEKVEFVQPHLVSKKYHHFVFQVVTNEFENKDSVFVSGLNWYMRKNKALGIDIVRFTVGTNVSAERILEEVDYMIKEVDEYSKGRQNVCFSIEVLKSHISKDFMNDFVSNVDLSETRLNDCMSFWNESAKTLSIYNV